MDIDQRDRLRQAKLVALARPHEGSAVGGFEPTGYPGGAALLASDRCWIMLGDESPAGLGGCLAWAERNGVRRLDLAVEAAGGDLARQASSFSVSQFPITVHEIVGTELRPAQPTDIAAPPVVPTEIGTYAAELAVMGVDVVAEPGRLAAEYLGLEVGRFELRDDGLHVEVGVGKNDQLVSKMASTEADPMRRLAAVVAEIANYRVRDAMNHPANRLNRARWLRSDLVSRPADLGFVSLTSVAAFSRSGVLDEAPAPALGVDASGAQTIVVVTTGVDLGLVPVAADLRAWHAPDAALMIALPHRDVHQRIVTQADALASPATVIGVDAPWDVLSSS